VKKKIYYKKKKIKKSLIKINKKKKKNEFSIFLLNIIPYIYQQIFKPFQTANTLSNIRRAILAYIIVPL
jgi:hypothetical protein